MITCTCTLLWPTRVITHYTSTATHNYSDRNGSPLSRNISIMEIGTFIYTMYENNKMVSFFYSPCISDKTLTKMNISSCQRGIYVFAGVIGSDVPWLDYPASRPHHNGDTFYITRKTMNNQCFMYVGHNATQ